MSFAPRGSGWVSDLNPEWSVATAAQSTQRWWSTKKQNIIPVAEAGLPKRLSTMDITYYIFLAVALFVIGIVGVLTRRNAIIIFMCIELMLNAVNLLLVAFSKMHHLAGAATNPAAGSEGQLFVFFIMVVAAAEVSVGLAIIVMLYRNTHSVDVNFLNRLKH